MAQIEAKDEIEVADSSLKTIAGTLDFQVISLMRNGVQCKRKKSELFLNGINGSKLHGKSCCAQGSNVAEETLNFNCNFLHCFTVLWRISEEC